MKSYKRNFAHDLFVCSRGSAVLEFVLFLPLVMVLFFGVVEATRYITALQKLERTTYAISNLISQLSPAQDPVVNAGAEISVNLLNNNVFPNIARMMMPFNQAAQLRAIVTSTFVANPVASQRVNIEWQIAGGGTLDNGDTVSITNGLRPSEINAQVRDTEATFNQGILDAFATRTQPENMLVIEVFYDYQPLVANILGIFGMDSFVRRTLVSRSFLMPRNGNLLNLPNDFPVR